MAQFKMRVLFALAVPMTQKEIWQITQKFTSPGVRTTTLMQAGYWQLK
jgi:hypothetical protein